MVADMDHSDSKVADIDHSDSKVADMDTVTVWLLTWTQ